MPYSSGTSTTTGSNKSAFALWCHGDSAIVTWGDADLWRWQFGSSRSAQGCAADSSHWVRPLLRFWKMDPSWPGEMHCMAVTVRQLEISSRVCSRFKPPRGFAAILEDGSVVTWGDATSGGDSSAVRDQLKGVQQIQATHTGCLCCDSGRWICRYLGWCNSGGDSSAVRDQLKGVQQIQATVGPLLRFWKMDPS